MSWLNVLFDVFTTSFIMLMSFFGVFLLMFLIAMMFMPVEKSISKVIWDLRAPKRPVRPQPQAGGFKGFSQKHN